MAAPLVTQETTAATSGASRACAGTCAHAHTGPTRRAVLAVGASLAGAGVLVACGAPDDDAPAQDAGSAGAGSGGGEGSGEAGGGASLAALEDVPVGGALSATTAAGDPIILVQAEEGTVVAFSAVCTHSGCTVAPDGEEIVCPCHGSVFDLTGKNVDGPAPSPLPPVEVEVRDGQVVEV
ncbi:ubiquinol-cytochrome c reductase iron-sulfur subunit [Actinotalea subterranea]|uniref:QcrA and Rieske domain-containing protein n=1 Tax=Actinotalea subterranea TaxID=2607497 RepID=UPI0011ED5651|nr:Rieske (2Fe-2S) protein [Actinotalea subterranea]